MSSDPNIIDGSGTTSKCQDHHKDACSYSVEIAKQFITLSSAGIAFVVGLALAKPTAALWQYYAAILALTLSVGCGLAYLMNVVGHIGREQNYDIYTKRLTIIAVVQIAMFFVAVFVLGKIVYERIAGPTRSVQTPTLIIRIGDRSVGYTLPDDREATIVVQPNDAVSVTLAPKR